MAHRLTFKETVTKRPDRFYADLWVDDARRGRMSVGVNAKDAAIEVMLQHLLRQQEGELACDEETHTRLKRELITERDRRWRELYDEETRPPADG